MPRPRVFIGSSRSGLEVARNLQEHLDKDADVAVWDQGIFQPSTVPIESLVAALDRFDAAIFVMTPDDLTLINGIWTLTPRDNVLFELGLFIGRLGRERCIIVMPDEPSPIHLPTDLLGVTVVFYHLEPEGDLLRALGQAANKIRRVLKDLPRCPAPSLFWLPVLRHAPSNFTEQFHDCKTLTVVGITNDQVSKALGCLVTDGRFANLTHIRLYYLDPWFWRGIPSTEYVNCPAGTVKGDVCRAAETLEGEVKRATALAVVSVAGKDIPVIHCQYRLLPAAAMLAGDCDEPGQGHLQVTPYIWGRNAGSCPTYSLDPKGQPDVFMAYWNYLRLVMKNSVDLTAVGQAPSAGPGQPRGE